jgi:hypothetical protein
MAEQQGAAMKIYMLMALISVIAWLSHYAPESEAPERQA